jgi:hypothetical protein
MAIRANFDLPEGTARDGEEGSIDMRASEIWPVEILSIHLRHRSQAHFQHGLRVAWVDPILFYCSI